MIFRKKFSSIIVFSLISVFCIDDSYAVFKHRKSPPAAVDHQQQRLAQQRAEQQRLAQQREEERRLAQQREEERRLAQQREKQPRVKMARSDIGGGMMPHGVLPLIPTLLATDIYQDDAESPVGKTKKELESELDRLRGLLRDKQKEKDRAEKHNIRTKQALRQILLNAKGPRGKEKKKVAVRGKSVDDTPKEGQTQGTPERKEALEALKSMVAKKRERKAKKIEAVKVIKKWWSKVTYVNQIADAMVEMFYATLKAASIEEQIRAKLQHQDFLREKIAEQRVEHSSLQKTIELNELELRIARKHSVDILSDPKLENEEHMAVEQDIAVRHQEVVQEKIRAMEIGSEIQRMDSLVRQHVVWVRNAKSALKSQKVIAREKAHNLLYSIRKKKEKHAIRIQKFARGFLEKKIRLRQAIDRKLKAEEYYEQYEKELRAQLKKVEISEALLREQQKKTNSLYEKRVLFFHGEHRKAERSFVQALRNAQITGNARDSDYMKGLWGLHEKNKLALRPQDLLRWNFADPYIAAANTIQRFLKEKRTRIPTVRAVVKLQKNVRGMLTRKRDVQATYAQRLRTKLRSLTMTLSVLDKLEEKGVGHVERLVLEVTNKYKSVEMFGQHLRQKLMFAGRSIFPETESGYLQQTRQHFRDDSREHKHSIEVARREIQKIRALISYIKKTL